MGRAALEHRKLREIEGRVEGIRRAMATLPDLAQNGDLAENSSQITRVLTAVGALVDEVDAHTARENVPSAHDWATLEELLLTVYRIFGYFWEKFAQRQTDGARTTLLVADDLAFACYQPVRRRIQASSGQTAPPPLICFDDSGRGAYSLPRFAPFDRYLRFDWDTGPAFRHRQNLTSQQVAALKALPMPVIALPWFTLGHPVDLLIIAHEVGHLVAIDLGLATDGHLDPRRIGLGEVFGAATPVLLSELFPDAYATLCLGLPFGYALADYLAATPPDTTATHPAPTTRIHHVAAVLRRMNRDQDAEALLRRWSDEWPVDPERADPISAEALTATAAAILGSTHDLLGKASLSELEGLADATYWRDIGRVAFALEKGTAIPPGLGPKAVLGGLGLAVGTSAGEYGARLPAEAMRSALDQRAPEWRNLARAPMDQAARNRADTGELEDLATRYRQAAREILADGEAPSDSPLPGQKF